MLPAFPGLWLLHLQSWKRNIFCSFPDFDSPASLFKGLLCREDNGTPLQYSCLENPMDGGASWAAVHGVAKSQTWLSNFTFTFQFHALEKEMATHSSVLAWRSQGWGRTESDTTGVGHDWSDSAVAVAVKSTTTLFRGWVWVRAGDSGVDTMVPALLVPSGPFFALESIPPFPQQSIY